MCASRPAIPAAVDVTICTSSAAGSSRPCSASSRRATLSSASRLVEPDGSQSAPRPTGMPAASASAASVVSPYRRRFDCGDQTSLQPRGGDLVDLVGVEGAGVDQHGARRRRVVVEEALVLARAALVAALPLRQVQVERVDRRRCRSGRGSSPAGARPGSPPSAGRSWRGPGAARRRTGRRCAPAARPRPHRRRPRPRPGWPSCLRPARGSRRSAVPSAAAPS